MKNKKSTIIALIVVVLLGFGYLARADLQYHTEALMNALALALDSDHDGDFTDETWYIALTTPTWALAPTDDTLQGGIQISGTAGEDLAQWDLVRKDPTNLKYYKFIAASATKVSGADTPFGMVTTAASADAAISVVIGEFMVYNAGWGMGAGANLQIFPNTSTAGLLNVTGTPSATSGDIVSVVGMAVAANKIMFRLPAIPSVEVP